MPVNDEPILSITGLEFGYSGQAAFLGPIDLDLDPASMLAVIGPNGAGKSTLLRLMVGLLTPRCGRVVLSGRPLRRISTRRRAATVAFLPQAPQAPPDLTAREVVLLGRFPRRKYRFFDSPEDHRIAEDAMRTTETIDFADRTLDTLSAGERQRVFLAAAMAQEPGLLVLDEPTSALDPYHQLSIFGLLVRLCRQRRMSVVVVTHDLNLAGQHCDTLLLLAQGQAVAMDTADHVLKTDILQGVYGVCFQSGVIGPESRPWVLPVPPATVDVP